MQQTHRDRLAAIKATAEIEVSGVTSKVVNGAVVPEGKPSYAVKIKNEAGEVVASASSEKKADAYESAIAKAEKKLAKAEK